MGIPAELYPFQPHWLDLKGARMHYVDEGDRDAPPVLFVHGNPSWSFMWRDLIRELRTTHRCVALDHIGCGKSDKPPDSRYAYRLEQRVSDLGRLVDALDLHQVTLIAHDWGGMIGLAWALRHPARVARIALMNTSAFHLPPTKRLPLALWLTRTPVGSVLVRGFNAFALGAARFGTERPLAPAVRQGLLAPYDSWGSRRAVLRFVQDIPLRPSDPGYDLVSEVAAGVERFADRPVMICWGEKDFVFDRHFLSEWERRLPSAQIHRFPNAGHYVLEDETDAIVNLVRKFVETAA